MKLYLMLLICFVNSLCYAQDNKYIISKPLDIKEAGMNRILCMKNGNTLLFHFEKGKKIVVKVFDSTHKLIASQRDDYQLMNFHLDFLIRGLFEANGEAVLFFDQELNSRHCLIRIRYNSQTGNLVEEKLVAESNSANKRILFYVMKNKESENYEVLFCTDKNHPKESDLYCIFFDNKHNSIKEVQLPVDRKKYDGLEIVGAESQQNDLLITVSLTKTLVFARGGSGGPIQYNSSTDDHFLQFFYIPMDSKNMSTIVLHLSTGVFPYYSYYTYNPFAQMLNLFLYSYKAIDYQFGRSVEDGFTSRNLFFKIDPQNISSLGVNDIKNTIANDSLKKETDTSNYFLGIPLKMYTNENGLSTLISKSVKSPQAYTSNIVYLSEYVGITQFDDNGNEIWGTVLPGVQHYSALIRNYRQFPLSSGYSGNDQNPVDYNVYSCNKNFYIIFNDYDTNFTNTLKDKGLLVYSFEKTNGMCYKINNKKEVTKSYLFGAPGIGDYKYCFLESADFDEQRGVYSSLVRYRKNNKTTLCVAWCHLD